MFKSKQIDQAVLVINGDLKYQQTDIWIPFTHQKDAALHLIYHFVPCQIEKCNFSNLKHRIRVHLERNVYHPGDVIRGHLVCNYEDKIKRHTVTFKGKSKNLFQKYVKVGNKGGYEYISSHSTHFNKVVLNCESKGLQIIPFNVKLLPSEAQSSKIKLSMNYTGKVFYLVEIKSGEKTINVPFDVLIDNTPHMKTIKNKEYGLTATFNDIVNVEDGSFLCNLKVLPNSKIGNISIMIEGHYTFIEYPLSHSKIKHRKVASLKIKKKDMHFSHKDWMSFRLTFQKNLPLTTSSQVIKVNYFVQLLNADDKEIMKERITMIKTNPYKVSHDSNIVYNGYYSPPPLCDPEKQVFISDWYTSVKIDDSDSDKTKAMKSKLGMSNYEDVDSNKIMINKKRRNSVTTTVKDKSFQNSLTSSPINDTSVSDDKESISDTEESQECKSSNYNHSNICYYCLIPLNNSINIPCEHQSNICITCFHSNTKVHLCPTCNHKIESIWTI